MKIIITIILCCWAILTAGCGTPQRTDAPTDLHKLQVVASFNATRELTAAIGGDKVEIKTIIPDGTEPHEFEPKATDLTALSQARVLILNGMDMEPWAEKAVAAAGNKELAVVIVSKDIDPIIPQAKTLLGQHHTQGQPDPHTWLSIKNAGMESKHICEALSQADPENKDYYKKNYQDFQNKLDILYNNYDKKFRTLPRKTFVTGHAAFGYLARDFSLEQDSLTDVFAAGEPSARRLKELADLCKEKQIKVIFVENMENPRIAQTLATETNAAVEGLDTLESCQPDKDYLAVMQENLEKIYTSMN